MKSLFPSLPLLEERPQCCSVLLLHAVLPLQHTRTPNQRERPALPGRSQTAQVQSVSASQLLWPVIFLAMLSLATARRGYQPPGATSAFLIGGLREAY